MANRPSVFITGANGYIGSAVGRAFSREGWNVYGLVRRQEAAAGLARNEMIPIIGTLDNLDTLKQLYKFTSTVNVIVGATEVVPGYKEHFEEAIRFVRALAKASVDNGVRPLVLWTSGCKDYGVTDLDGAEGLEPHTEESPVEPTIDFLQERAASCPRVFENTDLFDGVVMRPPHVYGYGSSHFKRWFEVGEDLKRTGDTMELTISPKTIMHSMHVDDCGEAYVALAKHPKREEVAGQAFNVSSSAYETTGELIRRLEEVYDIPGQVQFVDSADATKRASPITELIFGYSQWVSSEKIRRVTGWKDTRMLFGENLLVYKMAYESSEPVGSRDTAAFLKGLM